MACRAALLAVLPSTCSALAVHTAAPRDASFLDAETRWQEANQGVMEQMLTPAAEVDCQEAQAGSECYLAVQYLRLQGFESHPTWYPGYSSRSSFGEVQDMLYGLMKSNCPKPCFVKASPQTEQAAEAKFNCKDTAEGDLCYASIAWLKEVGFGLHPEWYPGLGKDSSIASIQAELHRNGKSDCSQPCAPTDAAQEKAKAHMQMMTQAKEQETQGDDCMDAVVGTQCYTDVAYGMAEGIRKHPQFYEGVHEASTFKQVQEYLYLNNRSFCERPCPAPKMSLDVIANHYQEFREKKRVEDMSQDELARYLNGDWDGYVAKMFRSPDDHTTFEKRKYDPTTTPAAEAREEEAPADAVGEASAPPQGAPPPQEEIVHTKTDAELAAEAELQAAAQRKAEAERLAKEAAEAVADAVEQPFPELTASILSTDAARNLRACLMKLRDVTSETLSDIKGECEEQFPLEGADRDELVKESMRYFLWAQRHVQFLKASEKATAEEPQAEEPKAEEPKAEEPKAEEAIAKDQDIVDEPLPEIAIGHAEKEATPAEQATAAAAVDPQPAASERAETPEEMEQRLRKQLVDELKVQTTAAPHKETEEEMRERIKAEVVRELQEQIRAQIMQQRSKEEAPAEASHGQ
mmetsp:Transcript_55139/g.147151  ORF Transcript_55139/g.147151 Transcript_55139/m.147151 type:complete len:634 (+) Transcript_55139:77-1978(+)